MSRAVKRTAGLPEWWAEGEAVAIFLTEAEAQRLTGLLMAVEVGESDGGLWEMLVDLGIYKGELEPETPVPADSVQISDDVPEVAPATSPETTPVGMSDHEKVARLLCALNGTAERFWEDWDMHQTVRIRQLLRSVIA